MIEVKGITKKFGRTTAVDQVSFEVKKGEIVGFLGPNGAGKTTTMRILTCFLPPTDGTALVAGYDIHKNPLEVKRRIGYLPESPPLYPEMTVADYLDFVARIKGLTGERRRERIDSVIARCAITDVRKVMTGRLSKGYRQRVGLAQALVHDPELLILDEPTAGLDPAQIIETRELIKSLAGQHTIILSTHILPEVSMTCQRVVIIKQGRIVAEDTPQNLTARLKGSDILVLTVEGSQDEARETVSAVAGVVRVRTRRSSNGSFTFEIEKTPGRDIRSSLARAIVEAGLGLLELKQEGMSLEDIFLQLTTEEAAPAAEPVVPAAATGETGQAEVH